MSHAFKALTLIGLLIFPVGCGDAPAPQQNPPAKTYQAPPVVTRSATFEGVDHLPGDSAFVLVVPDVLPHLQTVLTHPGLQRVLAEGALGQAFARNSGTAAPDPVVLWNLIEMNRQFVPEEIAVSFSEGGIATLDHSVRGFMLGALCAAANSAGSDAIENELPRLQEQLGGELSRIRLPRMTLWCKFRDQQTASIAWQSGVQMADQFEMIGLAVQHDGDSMHLSGQISDFLPAFSVELMLAEMGVGEFGDESLSAIAESVADLPFEIGLERIGQGMRLSIGAQPETAAPALTAEQLGPLYSTRPEDVLFVRWDSTGFKQAVAGWNELWNEWKDTETGREAQTNDEEAILGDLMEMQRQTGAMADSGAMRVFAENSMLQMTSEEVGAAPGVELRGTAVASHIPSQVKLFALTGTESLAHSVADAIGAMEERLATNSLRAEFGDDATQRSIYDLVTTNYYGEFTEFREIVFNAYQDAFEPPAAFLIATEGEVDMLRIPPLNTTLTNLPIIEFAAIGQIKDPDLAQDYVPEMHRALVEGMTSIMEKQLPANYASVTETDLGLGVTTYVLDASWLEQDGQQVVSIEGDFEPHYFIQDDLFVFSTSPRLSKLILNPAAAATLPAVEGDGKLTSVCLMSGQVLADSYAQLGAWLEAWLDQPEFELLEPDPEMENMLLIMRGLGEIGGLLTEVSWESVEEDDLRRTQVRFAFSAR